MGFPETFARPNLAWFWYLFPPKYNMTNWLRIHQRWHNQMVLVQCSLYILILVMLVIFNVLELIVKLVELEKSLIWYWFLHRLLQIDAYILLVKLSHLYLLSHKASLFLQKTSFILLRFVNNGISWSLIFKILFKWLCLICAAFI